MKKSSKKSPQLRLWEDVKNTVSNAFGRRAVISDDIKTHCCRWGAEGTSIRIEGIGSRSYIDLSRYSSDSEPGAVFCNLTVEGLDRCTHSGSKGALLIRTDAGGKTSFKRDGAFRNVNYWGESEGRPYTMAQIRDAVDEVLEEITEDVPFMEAFGEDAGQRRARLHYWAENEGFSLPESAAEQVELARKIEIISAFDLYRRLAREDGMSEEAVERAIESLSDPEKAYSRDFITPYIRWKLDEMYGDLADNRLSDPGFHLNDTRYFLYPLGSDGKQAKGEK